MLHAVDERLSIWGWETGTGTRFAIVIDAWGISGNRGSKGLSDGDLRGVSPLPFCRQKENRRGFGECRDADMWGILGFQDTANSVYTAVAEPILCAG